jgi:hypothetical protein
MGPCMSRRFVGDLLPISLIEKPMKASIIQKESTPIQYMKTMSKPFSGFSKYRMIARLSKKSPNRFLGERQKKVTSQNAPQFDERGWETERWSRLRHRYRAKAAGNSYSLCPHVTAPILDSTVGFKKGFSVMPERVRLTSRPGRFRYTSMY